MYIHILVILCIWMQSGYKLTNNPKHNIPGAKQIQNRNASNIQCNAQLINAEQFSKQNDWTLDLPNAITSVHQSTHYNQNQWWCDPETKKQNNIWNISGIQLGQTTPFISDIVLTDNTRPEPNWWPNNSWESNSSCVVSGWTNVVNCPHFSDY